MSTRCKTKAKRSSADLEVVKGLSPDALHMDSLHVGALGSIVDNLRFKIVSRDGQHFFTEVRLAAANISERERTSIVKLLDGESLENLTPNHVSSKLKRTRHANEVQDMISELQSVLLL